MADEGTPLTLRSASLLRKVPQESDEPESATSTTVVRNTGRVVLAPAHQLPAHLIQLLEEWHKDHPDEPPLAAITVKPPIETSKSFQYLSPDRKQYPLLEEITISKPVHYVVNYLAIEDGAQTGALVRHLAWGSRICFLKKWIGGYDFQAEPVAVRLPEIDGVFVGEFPTEFQWKGGTERKLPNESRLEEAEPAVRSSVSRKRSREERDSTSSSGSDIYPEIIKPSLRQQQQQQQRARSEHVRPSASASEDVGIDEDEDEDHTPPVGLSNGGLPIITRSATTTRLTTARSRSSRNPKSRASLPHPLHGGASLSTSPLMINAPSTTTSDSGVDIATSVTTSHPQIDSSSPAIITFKLRIPRTRMERHIRIEDNEQTADDLFKEATHYFRRHDRLIGTPILECVVEGETDCRCIYNAKELRYFIEELRERRGIVKVTVTQSF